MSPLEYIEKGIREGSWETVCEGYERLTGKAIPLPGVGARQTVGVNTVFEKALQQIYDIVAMAMEEPGFVPSTNVVSDEKPQKKKPGRPKGSKEKKKKIADGEDSSLQLSMEKRTPGRDDDSEVIQAQAVQQKTDKTHLITNDPDPEEVEANKEKAVKANRNKVQLNRTPAVTFKIECSECEQKFKSYRPKGKFGQKCPRCLKNTKGRFGG